MPQFLHLLDNHTSPTGEDKTKVGGYSVVAPRHRCKHRQSGSGVPVLSHRISDGHLTVRPVQGHIAYTLGVSVTEVMGASEQLFSLTPCLNGASAVRFMLLCVWKV